MKGAKTLFAAAFALLVILSTSKGQAQTQGPNGHFYKVVLEPNLLWEEARIKAAQSTFNDQHGYLATISSAAEDQFINSLRQQAGTNVVLWLGGSQQTNAATSADGWVWVGGEGAIAGENGGATYANWLAGEPNDAGGPNSEQFLAIAPNGWSSESDDGHVEGYVIEYPSAGAASRVSVVMVDSIALEPPATDVATFEFRRDGDLSQDLPVFYTVSGAAANGQDYDEIARSIIIPAGSISARLDIVPRPDAAGELAEPMETVGIRIDPSLILTPDAAYTIDSFRREAAAVIYESGPPASGALQLATPPHGTTYQFGDSIIALAALSFSNQIPTIDLYATDRSTGVSNKVATAFGILRTNELAFYKLTWTNATPGDYHIVARSTNSAAPQFISPAILVIVAAPTNIATVKIRAVPTDNSSASADYASGYFEISRIGPTNANLQVHYTISGAASMGEDYNALQNYAVIAAGRTSARINLVAVDDDAPEGNEPVTLTLLDSASPVVYNVDESNRQATVSIIDAESSVKFLNIDFTSYNGTIKTGPAAVGLSPTDYWNFWNNEAGSINGEPDGPRWSDKTPSGINLSVTRGGGWGTGSSDPMLHTYIYGGSRLTANVTNFPASTVDVYVYAHGLPGGENGVITVAVNGALKGTKSTTTASAWDTPGWTEGNEYVVFRNLTVPTNGRIQIHADPGQAGMAVLNGAQIVASFGVTAPKITKQPASATLFAGDSVVLSVDATGGGLTYQWRLNDVPLEDETASTLHIPNFSAANVGSYSVRIKNTAGEVLSSSAKLALAARASSKLLDIDYTAHLNPAFSVKTGPAAIGIAANEVWNVYSRDASSQFDWRAGGQVNALKWTDGTVTAASLTVTNAGGAWLTLNDDPMFKSYLYPLSRSGDITSTLQGLPPQRYDIYVYAHGQIDSENAAVELKLNGISVGNLSTSSQPGWDGAGWVDGNQFVVFRGIEVTNGTTVEVISRAGAADIAVINGMQLAAQQSGLRIVSQPVSQTVTNGQAVSFSVTAEGTGTNTYQWFRNGVEIPGATSSALTIAAAATADAGVYAVRVQNNAAVAVSEPATLVIDSGGAAQRKLLNIDFSVTGGGIKVGPSAVGETATDYWNFYNKDTGAINGEPAGPRWSDKTSSGIQLSVTPGLGAWGTGSSDPMLHTYLYTHGAGRITATLTAFPASRVDVYVYAHGLPGSENGVVTLAVNGVSQGQKSTTTIAGWDTPGWIEGNEYVVFRNITVPANATLAIHSDPGVSGQAVINGAQVVASIGAGPPKITKEPVGATLFAGETAVLSVEATGSNLTYQWRLNDVPLEGKTAATLEIQNFAAANVGSYSVRVKNDAGEVVSSNADRALATRVSGRLMDIDYTAHRNAAFGVKTGPAAVGRATDDFWNVYSRDVSSDVDWRAGGTVSNLKWTDGAATTASLTVTNAEGAWFTLSDDAMLESYLYPLSRSGAIGSRFDNLPAQRYDIYVYAHGQTTNENASIELKVGGASVGTRTTSAAPGWDGPAWVDGNQFVTFYGIEVPAGASVEIISRADAADIAVINGIQLAAQPSTLRIVTQPQSQTVAIGASADFSVQAQGEGTLTYQWLRNGAEIAGATSSTFSIESAELSDAGGYSVRVRNDSATVISQVATLAVSAGNDGQGNLLNVDYGTISDYGRKIGPAAVGLNTNDHWNVYSRDSQSLVEAPQGMKWSDGTLAGAQMTVQNADGAWGSNAEDMMMHTYLYPTSRVGDIASTFSAIPAGLYDLFVYAHGQPADENGVIEVIVNGISHGIKSTSDASDWDSPGWTEGKEYVLFANVDIPTNATVQIVAKPGVSGLSVINGVQFLSAPLAPAPPTILTQPQSVAAFVGETFTLNVTADGSRPLTYQWRLGGTNLTALSRFVGVNTPYLTVSNALPRDAGQYSVVVMNSLGEVTSSNAVVTVAIDTNAPQVAITSPTAGAHDTSGFSLQGSVTDNNAIASVTWFRNGVLMGNLTLADGKFSVTGLRLAPGVNLIRVVAVDVAGNEAAAEVSASFTVPRAIVLGMVAPQQDGSRFVIPISVVSTGGVSGATFTLTFDTNYLADAQFDWSDSLSSGLTVVNLEASKRFRASFALPALNLAPGSNHIATVSFRARSVPTTLQTPLALELVGIYDEDGDAYISGNSANSTALTINKRKIVGDNNANDRLDIGDASVVLRMVSRVDPVRTWDRPLNDLNKNTDLDPGDVIKVLRTVVGLDPQPQAPVAGALATKKSQAAQASQFVPGILVADKNTAAAGEKVTVEVRLTSAAVGSGPISGASFRLKYPVEALKLESASAQAVGSLVPTGAVALWNVSPAQNNYATQDGTVSFAVSSAGIWPGNVGVLARLTFTVQAGASARYGWPVIVENFEISHDGFATEFVGNGLWTFTGHAATGAELNPSITFAPDGKPTITLHGDIGASFSIEASSDLTTWTPIGTVYSADGTISIQDNLAGAAGARFYRAIQLAN